MKIAVGMADENVVNEDHFGQSKFFEIFEYSEKGFKKLERRENPKYGIHQHAKVSDMLEILDDCKVWSARNMGKGSYKKLQELDYIPIIVKSENLDEALKEIEKEVENALGR
jgi:nitrogen fixation protein NifX